MAATLMSMSLTSMAAASSVDMAGVLDDLLKMVDTLYDIVANRNNLIDILKEKNAILRKHLNLPQMITSPPTPLSVDTCEDHIKRVRRVLDPTNSTIIRSGGGLTAVTDL